MKHVPKKIPQAKQLHRDNPDKLDLDRLLGDSGFLFKVIYGNTDAKINIPVEKSTAATSRIMFLSLCGLCRLNC